MKRRLTACAALLLVGPGLAQAAAPATKTVSGTISEPCASVTVNTVPASVDNTALTFTASVPFEWGSNTITVVATDMAGITGTKQITVELGINGNVQGTVTDASPPTTVTVNGASVPLTNGAFSTTVPLKLGINTITVVAQDTANNPPSTKTSRVFLARPPVEHP
jgi:hypothetical protein